MGDWIFIVAWVESLIVLCIVWETQMLWIFCDWFIFIHFVICTLHYISLVLVVQLCFIHTRTIAKATSCVTESTLFHAILITSFILAPFIVRLVMFESNLSSLFFFSIFVGLDWLVVPPTQFVSSFEFIFNRLVNASVAWSTFYVYCLQVTHVGLIHCDTILKRVFLWTFK